jgi:predicted RNase H-like HicB family nuclease
MDLEKYRVCVAWSDVDKAFLAEMPELPGCMADGRTQEEALANLREVASEWIETALALGRSVPNPEAFRQMVKTTPG